jgi:hypothetical protein
MSYNVINWRNFRNGYIVGQQLTTMHKIFGFTFLLFTHESILLNNNLF